MADNWEIFVRLHRDEVVGLVLHTRLHNFLAVRFTIPFIAKLITTVRSSADNTTIISAAAIIHDVAGYHFFQQALNSPSTTVEALAFLRRSAIDFMLNGLGIVAVQECGKFLAAKLLCSALEIDAPWFEFVQLARRGFFFEAEDYVLRNSILDIIYNLSDQSGMKFMKILELSRRENDALFPPMMTMLLEAGIDHRLYRILAFGCVLFTVQQWSSLMELAIMSSFFDNAHSSPNRISTALALRHCIDNGPLIHYYPHMISKMQTIISNLNTSPEPLESQAALKLYEAFAKRILNIPIMRHQCYKFNVCI